MVIPAQFSNAGWFSEGVAAVQGVTTPTPRKGARKQSRGGWTDYLFPEFPTPGKRPALVPGKWGYIDHGGAFVVKPQYDGALSFAEGLAAVKIGSQWGYIDHSGVLVIPAHFSNAESFAEGLAAAWEGNAWGYIDRTGKFSIPPQFEQARPFSDGVAAVRKGGKWGLWTRPGRS